MVKYQVFFYLVLCWSEDIGLTQEGGGGGYYEVCAWWVGEGLLTHFYGLSTIGIWNKVFFTLLKYKPNTIFFKESVF